MSDKKITELAASSTPLAGTEVLPVVQSNTTKKVAVSDLTAGRAVNMAGLNSSIGNNGGITGPSSGTWAAKVIANQDAAFYSGLSVQTRWANSNTPIFEAAGGWNGSAVGYYPVFTIDGIGQLTGKNLLTGNVTFTMASTGNLTLNLGNLVIGTSGKGIDFSADGQAAGMTSELLDDYEEGTFTPTIVGTTSAGTATYSVQTGRYTKVGRVVQFEIALVWSGGNGTGNLIVGGLPFNNSNGGTYPSVSIGVFDNIALTAGNIATAYVENNAGFIRVYQYPTGGGATSAVAYDAGGWLQLTGTYSV